MQTSNTVTANQAVEFFLAWEDFCSFGEDRVIKGVADPLACTS